MNIIKTKINGLELEDLVECLRKELNCKLRVLLTSIPVNILLVNTEEIRQQLQELEGCKMISKRYHATGMSMEQIRSPKREWNESIGMNCIKSERFQPF